MRTPVASAPLWTCLLAVCCLIVVGACEVQAESPRLDIYGHAMLDMGYQFKQNDPSWFDVVRPTKLPAVEDEFGQDGRWFSGVRQSRLGVKGSFPTDLGEVKTTFEFELFGVGVDAGQTTFRLRHAYGELGKFGAGQTWSPFMDIDVFPNSLEYWGPNGMVFFRNVQFRYMPIQGDTRMTIAVERPGASADLGEYRSGLEDARVQSRFPAPDVSAEYHHGMDWGYVEAAGIFRYIKWDDNSPNDAFDLDGDAFGWGVNVSSNINIDTPADPDDTIRLQVVYGEGIENYMNDAPADLGVVETGDPVTPVDGEALPILGVVAFYDHYWSNKWSTSAGYSLVDIDPSSGQPAEAFVRGHYALGNLLYYPAKNVMMGGEFQWARRENNSDGWTADDYRIQFSAKYSFSHTFGGM